MLALAAFGPSGALGGPPFATDDPEPVEHRHWEVYLASQHAREAGDWSGGFPIVEVNYGAIPELQIHLIAPLDYDAPAEGGRHYGYGDTELGAKYRFLKETAHRPQIGVFPLVEIPTGDAHRNLGSGHMGAFLPIWIQKSWGEERRAWTAYGGGGYHVNPGAENLDWGFFGVVLERQVREALLVGGEIYHQTPAEVGGESDTAFDLGVVYDFSEHHHLLFSGGRSIDGPIRFQAYAAYQLTLGPGR